MVGPSGMAGWPAPAGRTSCRWRRPSREAGLRWFAVTAIARDGGLAGPDLELLEQVRGAVPTAAIIASGGVGSLADIAALAGRGFDAAITGRALYEGAFSLPEGLATAAASAEAWARSDERG